MAKAQRDIRNMKIYVCRTQFTTQRTQNTPNTQTEREKKEEKTHERIRLCMKKPSSKANYEISQYFSCSERLYILKPLSTHTETSENIENTERAKIKSHAHTNEKERRRTEQCVAF